MVRDITVHSNPEKGYLRDIPVDKLGREQKRSVLAEDWTYGERWEVWKGYLTAMGDIGREAGRGERSVTYGIHRLLKYGNLRQLEALADLMGELSPGHKSEDSMIRLEALKRVQWMYRRRFVVGRQMSVFVLV